MEKYIKDLVKDLLKTKPEAVYVDGICFLFTRSCISFAKYPGSYFCYKKRWKTYYPYPIRFLIFYYQEFDDLKVSKRMCHNTFFLTNNKLNYPSIIFAFLSSSPSTNLLLNTRNSSRSIRIWYGIARLSNSSLVFGSELFLIIAKVHVVHPTELSRLYVPSHIPAYQTHNSKWSLPHLAYAWFSSSHNVSYGSRCTASYAFQNNRYSIPDVTETYYPDIHRHLG